MSWQGQKLLIVGLGMTGWSAVRYLQQQDAQVSVCDSRAEPPYAAQLADEFPHVVAHFGGLPIEALDGLDGLVVSPGLDLSLPFFARARDLGLPLMGDVEVFARDVQVPCVAVTGSNGKSTVVSLLAEMAQAAGYRAQAIGNIGVPVLEAITGDADFFVLELSSFQLELCESLKLKAAVVLNLSADHLDRHGDLAGYAAAKARIYQQAEHCVVNADDAWVRQMRVGAQVKSFSLAQDADFVRRDGGLYHADELLLDCAELKLVGTHNHANVLAAFAIGLAAGWPVDAMRQAAKEFAGLPHRCQWVADRKGVRWINDSKGTNVGATLAALEGLPPQVVLLAGGQAKGGDFQPWQSALREKARAVCLYGEDAIKIEQDLNDCAPLYQSGDLDTAVQTADRLAEAGDSVLLSPGCASFDQFSGYVARGERFVELVRALS